MIRSFDAVLFDMDGLMIDTESVSASSWRLAGESLDIQMPEELIHSMVGLSVTRSLERVIEHYGDRALGQALSEACRHHYRRQLAEDDIPLKTGIEAVLDWLTEQGIPRAVATSTQRLMADLKLQRTGLSRYFEISVAGDEVSHTKPAPDVFLAAAAKLDISPERCIVLEDSPYGLLAGHAAGMRVILVPDLIKPSAEDNEKALATCESLHDALSLLKAL